MSRSPVKRAAAPAAVAREDAELSLEDLVPNPRNPRVHSEEQIEHLMAALRTDGQTKPVLARRENRMLIAGHGVREAARRLGIEKLRVVLLDVDQRRADRMMLGDNRQGDLSTSDKAREAELLREIDQADWMATGYNDDDVAKALAAVEATDLRVHEIDFSDREDVFWISVKGPLRDQARALSRIKVLMGEMPQVTIALGTTDDLS